MRIATLALLLVSLSALADEPTEMYMPNDSGGYIVLTLEDCRVKTSDYPYRAYATESESGPALHEGCWTRFTDPEYDKFAESMVSTYWGPGLMASFRQRLFSPNKVRWTDDKNPMTIRAPEVVVKPNT